MDRPTVAELRLRKEQVRSAYRKLFATKDGQVVLNDLKEEFHDRSSIVPGDPYATHAREGAREVYLFIKELSGAEE